MAEKAIVILISGRGSNMEALLAAQLPARVTAVISNNPHARGLRIARDRGIAVAAVDDRAFADRAAFEAALATEIDRHHPDLVVLAGFMRILTQSFAGSREGWMFMMRPR